MTDIAIIGAGVVGCSIARELSKYDLKTVLIEKESDVGEGASKANSAIIHAGYDAKPGTLKAKFNVLGNPMYDAISSELDVIFKRVGSLVIALDDDEMQTLHKLYYQGIANGVPDMEIIGGKKVLKMEPNLSKDIKGALYAPTAGIICPMELTVALAENAVDNGVELMPDSKVTDIKRLDSGYRIFMGEKYVDTKYVINCAGLYSDEINNMVAPPQFKIIPRRGQYNIFDKNYGDFVKTVIFPCPSKLGKGILVSPTIHGNLLIGPDAEDLEDKNATNTTLNGLNTIRHGADRSAANIPYKNIITNFAGLRPKPDTDDFVIGESKFAKGFINVAGIESPGLTSAPAIAVYVVGILKDINGGLIEKEDYIPRRRKRIRFEELDDSEKDALIKKDPRFAKVICRCETVTEGEIIDVIRRNVGARTLDGVKKRARPGSGRCQGGFCSPRVIEILARELKCDISDIKKGNHNSYVLIKEDAFPVRAAALGREQCPDQVKSRGSSNMEDGNTQSGSAKGVGL